MQIYRKKTLMSGNHIVHYLSLSGNGKGARVAGAGWVRGRVVRDKSRQVFGTKFYRPLC